MKCIVCQKPVPVTDHLCTDCVPAWANAERQLGRTVTLSEMRGIQTHPITACVLCDTLDNNGILCKVCEAHLDNLPDYVGA